MEADPNYWKRIYKNDWVKGARREIYVRDLLRKLFPWLTVELTGYGAGRKNYVPLSSHEKGEPDITVSNQGELLCVIEVSGTDIELKPWDDIWVRPDKFEHAMKSTVKTWFYMIYANKQYVLDVEDILPFKTNIKTKYLKGPEFPENYILVPCSSAHPREKLLHWLSNS